METKIIFQALFAIIVVGLLIFISYKITTLDTILNLEKTQSIQMAGQSVAMGTISECLGCGNQVAARLSSFADIQ